MPSTTWKSSTKTAEQLPKVDRHDVYAHNEELDEWEEVPYRDSLWTDEGRTTGVVSNSQDVYNGIQYGDVLEAVGHGIDRSSIESRGRAPDLSDRAHDECSHCTDRLFHPCQ